MLLQWLGLRGCGSVSFVCGVPTFGTHSSDAAATGLVLLAVFVVKGRGEKPFLSPSMKHAEATQS